MSIIEFLKVVVLGIVEGFTEWLPISSTGHMILVDEIIHLNVTDDFMSMFRVVIQLGLRHPVCMIDSMQNKMIQNLHFFMDIFLFNHFMQFDLR